MKAKDKKRFDSDVNFLVGSLCIRSEKHEDRIVDLEKSRFSKEVKDAARIRLEAVVAGKK